MICRYNRVGSRSGVIGRALRRALDDLSLPTLYLRLLLQQDVEMHDGLRADTAVYMAIPGISLRSAHL